MLTLQEIPFTGVVFPDPHFQPGRPVREMPIIRGKSSEPEAGRRPILVIDDDPSILSTVGDVLEFEGYPVARASNGAEALMLIERMVPRLIILDMRMPVVDGWEFAARLKERRIEVPIVVMTAARDAQKWAREIGAASYLAKPFDLAELFEAVERFDV